MQIFGFVICATFVVYINAYPALETDLIAQPTPGQEYVFVQSSGTGARPIARKDKVAIDADDKHRFETSHKFPPSLKYLLHDEDDDDCGDKKKVTKKKVEKRDAPAPAPAGAIKLDVQKLLEKYKTELKTSTTEAPKPTTRRRNGGNRRTKKEARLEPSVTSPKPILTTSASAPKPIDDDDDDDIPLVASGSEKQRSRIQIKKGPNGQEYEYEYVYYYYDDDDNNSTVSNAHDGPSREKLAETTKHHKAETINEIVPSTRGRTRGRQLTDDETVNEERLPANTRFPPRSRNLNTTPLPEEETKTTTKGRSRGRSTTEAAPLPAEADNVSDETQGSRGRTRANVRRPSLDLVDNASFNTAGAESAASSPSFPTNLPAGPVRFLGATPNEQEDLPEPSVKSEADPVVEDASKDDEDVEVDTTTTTMSPMDKVALDLYAILQGTQKLSGEESIATSEESLTDSTDEAEVTTELTTETIIETTTPTTTTTTTTTTTPAPTTTTTTTTTTPAPAPTGRGRFKGRGRKTSASAVSTTEATPQTETKPKSKFSRPSFGNRPRNRVTTEASVEKEAKEETKPQTHARPTLSRGRFGASRTRPRTTAAPEEKEDDSSSSSSSSSTSAPVSRPSLTRPRATFNLRNRGHTTAAPATAADAETSEEAAGQEPSSTTARPRRIQPSTGVRPLRPGPRINLARNRPGSTTTEAPVEDHVTGDEDNQNHEDNEKQEPEEKVEESSAAPVDNSPLAKLRNKQKIQIKPKAAASTSVQVRRINPLWRRRPGQAAETSSETPAPESASSESPTSSDDENQTEESLASSTTTTTTTTTEEPRGLNKLLAGRRRLATRPLAHS